jgi:hypothetical protein
VWAGGGGCGMGKESEGTNVSRGRFGRLLL